MTDEQIVKALERCGNNDWCSDCPYYKSTSTRGVDCYNDLMLDALDIIKRKQVEIDRLKSMDLQVEASKKLEREIKNEAIKDFAESLKTTKATYYCHCGRNIDMTHSLNHDIDMIGRRLTEDSK